MARRIPSTKGGYKLIDEFNFIYHKHKLSADELLQFWTCEVKTCKCRVHTHGKEKENISIV